MSMSFKKVIFCCILIQINIISPAQQKTDGKFIFKSWLFLEHLNSDIRDNDFSVKDAELFAFFDNIVQLQIDTLKSTGFSKDFIFLSIASHKNNIVFNDSAIIYKKFNQHVHINIPVSNCDGYILAVNNKTGRSFRIMGFYGNDLLGLIREMKISHKNPRNFFLKNCFVGGVDFNCIYKGIMSKNYDSKKSYCLAPCSDFIIKVN